MQFANDSSWNFLEISLKIFAGTHFEIIIENVSEILWNPSKAFSLDSSRHFIAISGFFPESLINISPRTFSGIDLGILVKIHPEFLCEICPDIVTIMDLGFLKKIITHTFQTLLLQIFPQNPTRSPTRFYLKFFLGHLLELFKGLLPELFQVIIPEYFLGHLPQILHIFLWFFFLDFLLDFFPVLLTVFQRLH